jgi:hypothetical protein
MRLMIEVLRLYIGKLVVVDLEVVFRFSKNRENICSI